MREFIVTSLVILVILVGFGSTLIEPISYSCIGNDETEYLEFRFVPMKDRVYINDAESILLSTSGFIIEKNNLEVIKAQRTYRYVYEIQFDKQTLHITYKISSRVGKEIYRFDGICEVITR